MPKPKLELTDIVIAELTSKLRISGSLQTALLTCGISRETYDEWIEDSKRSKPKPMTVRLAAATLQAEAEIKMLREHELAKYFEKDWRALAWWLERKYPDEYAARKAKEAKTEQERDPMDFYDPMG